MAVVLHCPRLKSYIDSLVEELPRDRGVGSILQDDSLRPRPRPVRLTPDHLSRNVAIRAENEPLAKFLQSPIPTRPFSWMKVHTSTMLNRHYPTVTR